MTKAYVVIGSGYGDEGKGLFTDYLSSQLNSSIVVRFNGGAQAGHTVTTHSERHVFGHFGSNSFCDGATTYLSHFFVLNPLLYLKEKAVLEELGIIPHVVAHENCYITTPFDMVLNQWVEEKRSANRHGSCGVGFGETIARCEESEGLYRIQLKDLADIEGLTKKLVVIREEYFIRRVKELELQSYLDDHFNGFILGERFLHKYIEDLKTAFSDISVSQHTLPVEDLQEGIVFEGAQGLLLDQNMGAFPYVTRSNTGLKNVAELVNGSQITELEVVYATRCYTTRHGAGPMKDTLEAAPYSRIEDKTNIPNNYQGSLRFSYLDLDILKETLEKDKASVTFDQAVKFVLGISCLDQTDKVKFYHNGQLEEMEPYPFCEYVGKEFNMPVLASFGPTRNTIIKI